MTRGPVLLALAAVAALAGYGLGAGAEPTDTRLTVTDGYGARPLERLEAPQVRGEETVMRLLQRNAKVATRYGGGFVQSINGVAGGREDGRPVDWFYYVNGVLADRGAAAHELAPGDRIWWDHHDWGATQDIRAVVGAFPEPFVSGTDGKRLPVRLDCADDAQEVCDEVGERLSEVGVKSGRSGAGGFGGEGVLRVKVGRWAEVRKDSAVRRLEEGPRASGVFARPNAAGDEIALLDARGEAERTLRAGAGLVAATRMGGEAPTWIVTGTDSVGVAAAAAQLQESALKNHFAIAVEEGRPISLPLLPPPETP
jgi:Domain of unknown function (DUF4430)